MAFPESRAGYGRKAVRQAGGAAGMPKIGERIPNVIWLIADDVSRYDAGCCGNPVRTPNIDRLASEGIRFTNAFSVSPSCSPSRTAMYTGKYPHAAGAEDLHVPLPADEIILPALLRRKGYFSATCGKLHLGPEGERQFDSVYPRSGDWRTFFDNRPKDRPFFLSVGFAEAHRPFRENAIARPHSPEDVFVPGYLADCPEVREELALYYDAISFMDGEIGELLGRLMNEGIDGDTLVLYFSDQGMPFPRAKTSLYDSGLGVPLIARWKGYIPGGRISGGLTSLVDLAPTMLAAAGMGPADSHQGESFLARLFEPGMPGRGYVAGERNWHNIDDHIRCIRTGRFKYIKNYFAEEPFGHPSDIVQGKSYQAMVRLLDTGRLTQEQMLIFRAPRPAEELYDLERDPDEFRNVAGRPEYDGVLGELRSMLARWEREFGDVDPGKRMVNNINVRTGGRIAGSQPVLRR